MEMKHQRFEYKKIPLTIHLMTSGEFERLFPEMGNNGWLMVGVISNYAVFARPIQEPFMNYEFTISGAPDAEALRRTLNPLTDPLPLGDFPRHPNALMNVQYGPQFSYPAEHEGGHEPHHRRSALHVDAAVDASEDGD